uniref:hsp70-binding protein 1-like n=1 Tax=Styela clava TaxID=7725 RepID=UPI00193A8620|nr:hsp70-binding protein 1-like [Styela clava]
MADDPEQRRLQALLRFATEAGSHGSEPVSGADNDPADRAWLNEALQDYASGIFDPVKYMKQQLSIVYRYLQSGENADSSNRHSDIKLEDVHHSLEEVSDNCDRYDLASDLHKIGGFDVLLQCLKYKESGICWRACDVIATAAQNHEYCQNALVEMKFLPVLLRLIDDTSAGDKVREKAFYALSCTLRGNDDAVDHLENNDGFSVLVRAMQSEVPKLKMKCVFFVKSLCEDDTKYARIFHERGIEQQIVGMLRDHNIEKDDPENLNIVENVLGCLCSLILTFEKSKKECQDTSFGLAPLLRQMKEKFKSGTGEFDECIRFCDLISEACFNDDDTGEDR